MADVEVLRFDATARRVIADQQVRMFGFPRRLSCHLGPNDANPEGSHYRLVISGSPEVLVRPFVEPLGVDMVVGSYFEEIDGIFTGEARSVGNKGEIVGRLVTDGVARQAGSVALGDTITDLPMLVKSDIPILFNGSKTLNQHAKERGWPWLRVIEYKDEVTVLAYDLRHEGYVEVESENNVYSFIDAVQQELALGIIESGN